MAPPPPAANHAERRRLAALVATFAAHDRSPRIEAFAELHPALLRAGDAAGWRRAMTAPVLTLVRGDLAPAPPTRSRVRGSSRRRLGS